MTAAAALLRVPLTVAVIAAVLMLIVPDAMSRYAPYVVRPGIKCIRTSVPVRMDQPFPPGMCQGLDSLYGLNFSDLMVDSALRSLALLAGAALLALSVGTLLGVAAALLRRRAWASAGIIAATSLLSAVPAFFVAYFLQIAVVLVVGALPEGSRFLPVFGFGYDAHVILPLLSITLAATAFTAQLTAVRMQDVLDADFITTANAKGLATGWILGVHVVPHVRPVMLEALGSGLRVAVASLPIVEYLFNWRGIGQLALEAIGVHDAATFIFSALILATAFTVLSTLSDLVRPRALYRGTG